MTLSRRKELPKNGAAITTIVSTDLIKEIATHYHCACFEVLTGFKYIGELIGKWEEDNSHTFLFGAEESYGYLMGTYARDKDAVIAACLIAEVALLMQVEGRTLVDFLNDLYERYGLFAEKQRTLNFAPGPEGMEKMTRLMTELRGKNPSSIGGYRIEALEDYLHGFRGLPPSNVLLYQLEGFGKVIIRPSGTEPKIKIYGCARDPSKKATMEILQEKLDVVLKGAEALF